MRELFNQVDIDANRQGRLSPEQEKFIKASVDPKTWIWGAGITMALGILGGGCLVSIGAEGVFGILGPILGVAFLFCAYRWFTMWNLRRKLLNEPVTASDGTITFKKLDAVDIPRYSPETADGKRLYPQGLAGLSVMLPPGNYRFYYLPTRKWLLSSEPLSTEAELKANMTAVLASVFEFDPNEVPSLRMQGESGELKIAEGKPEIETSSVGTSGLEQTLTTDTYATIGGVQFKVPNKAAFAFIPELAYRVYYYEKEPTNFFSKIISMGNKLFIAAIEPL